MPRRYHAAALGKIVAHDRRDWSGIVTFSRPTLEDGRLGVGDALLVAESGGVWNAISLIDRMVRASYSVALRPTSRVCPPEGHPSGTALRRPFLDGKGKKFFERSRRRLLGEDSSSSLSSLRLEADPHVPEQAGAAGLLLVAAVRPRPWH
jgi:hypothetical protein